MKLLAWNLNHKATERRKLKEGVAEAVKRLQPDTVIFTEYVHGDSRAPLIEALTQMNYSSTLFSDRINLNNQVMIASRSPLERGELIGPETEDSGGQCNFLHVRIPSTGIEVVGLRAPAYETTAELKAYWTQLGEIVRGTRDRKILYAGDLNADPTTTRRPGDKHLDELVRDGWQIPHASGDWSYSSGTRVDHAILSPSLSIATAHYVTEIDGLVLAGRKMPGAISDHAALLVEFDH